MSELLDEKKSVDPFGRIGGKKDWNILDNKRKEHFVTSIKKEIPFFIKVHKAWLLMLEKQSVVETERAKNIMSALSNIDDEAVEDMIRNWTPSNWEPMLQLESYLTSKVGQIASDLNIARTIPPPFYRMELLPLLRELIDETIEFLQVILVNAEEHTTTVMPGYTHLQHAQPMTYGHYLVGLFDALERALTDLETAYTRTNQFELGCGALSGTSFDIDRTMPAELLGFDGVVEHSNDAVAATDFIINILCGLTNLFIPLSRVANDLDIWSSFEFNMVEVSDEICNPSSMMPQKKNPAIFEFCRMSLGKISGSISEVVCGAHATQYGDVIEMRELAFSIHPTMIEAVKQIKMMAQAVDSLIIKKERMAQLARQGFSTATELAAVLYRESSVPLRMAHGIVAETVRTLVADGKSIDAVTPDLISKISMKLFNKEIMLSPDQLKGSIDPVKFIEAHDSLGGVSSGSVLQMIDKRKVLLDKHRVEQKNRYNKQQIADENLEKLCEDLIS
jgi:argininosuccinate lyase